MLSCKLLSWFGQVLDFVYCREQYVHVLYLVTVQAVTHVLHMVKSSVDARSAGE